jgi:hypothetical protein
MESVLERLHPEIEWVEPEIEGLLYGGTHHGIEAVTNEVLALIPQTWERAELHPETWIDGGNTVVVVGEFSARCKGGDERTCRARWQRWIEVETEGKATVPSEGTKETKRLAYWFYGDLVTVHVSGERTDGRFSLLEWLQPPGGQTPLHGHKRCDQTMYPADVRRIRLGGPGCRHRRDCRSSAEGARAPRERRPSPGGDHLRPAHAVDDRPPQSAESGCEARRAAGSRR